MALATVCLWIANYIVSQTFPMMDADPWLVSTFHRGFPFWVYGAFCAVLLVFLCAFVPETKGKTLEEIERHWMKCTSRAVGGSAGWHACSRSIHVQVACPAQTWHPALSLKT
jgi:hypothetical protein